MSIYTYYTIGFLVATVASFTSTDPLLGVFFMLGWTIAEMLFWKGERERSKGTKDGI